MAREPVERIERSLTELQASGHVDTPEGPVAPGEWMIALGRQLDAGADSSPARFENRRGEIGRTVPP